LPFARSSARTCRAQQPRQLRRQRRKGRFRHAALRVYDDVPSRGYLRPLQPHHLTHAPPRVLLMLKPNRLFGRAFACRKAVQWELPRRFPAWYTASNSAFLKSLPAVAGLPALAGPPAPAELRIDAELPMVAGSAP